MSSVEECRFSGCLLKIGNRREPRFGQNGSAYGQQDIFKFCGILSHGPCLLNLICQGFTTVEESMERGKLLLPKSVLYGQSGN